MELGGVMLAAGMVLDIAEADHRAGAGRIRFTLHQVLGVRHGADTDWVTLDGDQRPSATTSWRRLRVEVRIDALKRSLAPNA